MCKVNFEDISSTQLALSAEMGGLGVSSASLLAFPAFLASAFGASDFLTTSFSETFEDVSFTKSLENWLSLTDEQESPIDGTQKNWRQIFLVKTAQDLISRMDDKRSKIFNAHQGKYGSQWLNVVPCKNLGLKLDDQHIRIRHAVLNSHEADVGISRRAFNARTARTVPNEWQTPRQCYHDSLGKG